MFYIWLAVAWWLFYGMAIWADESATAYEAAQVNYAILECYEVL